MVHINVTKKSKKRAEGIYSFYKDMNSVFSFVTNDAELIAKLEVSGTYTALLKPINTPHNNVICADEYTAKFVNVERV